MALVEAFQPTDATDAIWWGTVLKAASDEIIIQGYGDHNTVYYRGNFSYDYFGSVYGTLEEIDLYLDGKRQVRVQNLEVDAYAYYYALEIEQKKQDILDLIFAGSDEIHGSSGNDVSHALAGNDFGKAGDGDDIGYGGIGNDTMKGGRGKDGLYGEAGNDILRGGKGRDQLFGGSGKDNIKGGSGHDRLEGGSGRDTILGNEGQDTLRGGKGSDWIDGGAGKDKATGNAGADTFHFDKGDGKGNRIRDFAEGQDLVSIGKGAKKFGDLSLDTHDDGVLGKFADVSFILEDITLTDLDRADFLF